MEKGGIEKKMEVGKRIIKTQMIKYINKRFIIKSKGSKKWKIKEI